MFEGEPGDIVGRCASALFPREERAVARLAAVAEACGAVRMQGRRSSGVPFTTDIEASELADGALLCLPREVRDERLR